MNNDTVLVSTVGAVQARAEEVRTKLLKVRESIEDDYLDLCDLLREAQEGNYHDLWGFSTFGDWVETASGLDLSSRTAYYCITLSKKAAALGLNRDQLKLIKVSKLKEIMSLDLAEHEAEMRTLIQEAPGLSLEEVRNRVRALKGQSEVMYVTLKLDKEIKETLDEALEMARRNYGSVVSNGEVADISVSKAMELILVSYVQDVNNQDAGQEIAEEEV